MRRFIDRFVLIGAYLFVMVIALFGFAILEKQQIELAKQTEIRQQDRLQTTDLLCRQAKDTRDGLRLAIIANADLSQALVPKQSPDLLLEVERYEAEQLAILPEISCDLAPADAPAK